MNANVSKLLNEKINKEFYSAYLYLEIGRGTRLNSSHPK